MQHPSMKAREGYRWVRRHGVWREEPKPTDDELVKAAFLLTAAGSDEAIDALSGPGSTLWDLTATYADEYDGPLALCDSCNQPLETVSALTSGRCSACVVARREPTEESRAIALDYAQAGE